MFWKKKPAVGEPSKPKGIPELVGRYLVDLGRNPDWVWRLKCVMRPRPESKDAFDFRVFDKAQVVAWKVNRPK